MVTTTATECNTEHDSELTDHGNELVANAKKASEFIRFHFCDTDSILLRPLETWTDEEDRKRSRVDYGNTRYTMAYPWMVDLAIFRLMKAAEENRLNIFYGVCPREGGKHDLAWQIRKVHTLWCDIDHVTNEEVQERISEAGIPQPTTIVDSGNGFHVYWKLNETYFIDDAGKSPPVLTEWVEKGGGNKHPRKYIIRDDDRVYLDIDRSISKLSQKAQYAQDVIAGIAKALGGDHTHDLARILRVPWTYNRKNERNGKAPIPTSVVSFDPELTYSISDFDRFKTKSPEVELDEKVSCMPLPRIRKITPARADKLSELIALSALAQPGARSEPDFSVCCYGVENGIDREEVWGLVENVGKFAEQGRRYFDHTWGNAEHHARIKKFEKLKTKTKSAKCDSGDDYQHNGEHDSNGEQSRNTSELKPEIRFDPAYTPVHILMRQITDILLKVGGCYIRANQLVAVKDDSISPILSPPELSGLLNSLVEFFFVKDDGGEYKPLPPYYGSTWLNHPDEQPRLPAIDLFTRNPVYTDDWRLVEPGYDPKSKIYYAGPPVQPLEGTKHLDELLKDFCFRTPGDRTNYIGMLLTTILVYRFIGSKPAILFNGNQPGLGKSSLSQVISIVRDGHQSETASYNPNDEEFEKRLCSIVRRGANTIIIDNAKAKGKSPRIDSACLERSITDPILSFRLLGSSQDIRAENAHIFCLTANSPDVSRDLVTRSVVVNLFHEGDPERRQFSLSDPEEYACQHRIEILGELIGMVERWKSSGMRQVDSHSRFNKRGWGNIVGGILQACGRPDFLANSNEAASLLDDTRREFSDLILLMADSQGGNWTAKELVQQCEKNGILKDELGDGSSKSKSTKLGTLAGRFVDEKFDLKDDRIATFIRENDRKGNKYRVGIEYEDAEP